MSPPVRAVIFLLLIIIFITAINWWTNWISAHEAKWKIGHMVPFSSFPSAFSLFFFQISVYSPCVFSLTSLRFIICSLCTAAGSVLACMCACVSVCVRLWGLQGGNGLATCRDLRQVYAWLREIMEWHGLIWLRADQVFFLCKSHLSPPLSLSTPPPFSLCVFLCSHSYNLWEMKCPPALVL